MAPALMGLGHMGLALMEVALMGPGHMGLAYMARGHMALMAQAFMAPAFRFSPLCSTEPGPGWPQQMPHLELTQTKTRLLPLTRLKCQKMTINSHMLMKNRE